MNENEQYQQNPRSSAYVASIGIDPNRMRLDGWDEAGYFAYDDGPDPYGEGLMNRHAWPEGFDFAHFRRLWVLDSPSRYGNFEGAADE